MILDLLDCVDDAERDTDLHNLEVRSGGSAAVSV